MNRPKELTTKQKILRSLEEGNRKPSMVGRLAGGFMSILFSTQLIHLQTKMLSDNNLI